MPYKAQFVGLNWFHEEPPGTMRVLMPDGRNYKTIAPHKFSISVEPNAVVDKTGWAQKEVVADAHQVEFWPPPSKVVLEGTDRPGILDSKKQIPFLPTLVIEGPSAKIDPDRAKKVGDFEIRQGEFEAFLMPGKTTNDGSAILCELTVAHEGNITMTLTELPYPANPPAPAGAAPKVRTIVLKPKTEIAFINASRGEAAMIESDDHSAIYSQLIPDQAPFVILYPDEFKLPNSPSAHPFFTAVVKPALNGPGCSAMTTGG
ncbi:MAG: hypothetical protein QOC81_806 [Thermoanaerobaculia bacterium]|jgi:hypothetical protein|nr:hypothetical protein [Thermoanaerobaculia bacterium]